MLAIDVVDQWGTDHTVGFLHERNEKQDLSDGISLVHYPDHLTVQTHIGLSGHSTPSIETRPRSVLRTECSN